MGLLIFLLITTIVKGQTYNCGELPEVGISCRITSAGTGYLNFGIISFSYERHHTICNNGYEYFWTDFWW